MKTQTKVTAKTRKDEMKTFILQLLMTILIVTVLVKTILPTARIASGSMEPTYYTGDFVIGNKLAYKFSDPKRFDIVGFTYPLEEGVMIVKRIIGLPGETVEIRDGKIYIDGSEEPLDESYLKYEWTEDNDGYTFTVPENCYFLLGDNRDDSFDSRYWAQEALDRNLVNSKEESESYTFIPKENIKAKFDFIFLSTHKLGFVK